MKYIKNLTKRYPDLAPIQNEIEQCFILLKNAFSQKHKLLVAGNGGSCADADHIVGELMKGFVRKRSVSKEEQARLIEIQEDFGNRLSGKGKPVPAFVGNIGEILSQSLQGALPAIALHNHQSLNTAFSNDVNADMIYAQQVCGYGEAGDVFLAISTSGNAKNLTYAAVVAKARGLKVILLSGKDGGLLKELSDVSVIVPSSETYEIQERHLPIYHALCLELEEEFFGEGV